MLIDRDHFLPVFIAHFGILSDNRPATNNDETIGPHNATTGPSKGNMQVAAHVSAAVLPTNMVLAFCVHTLDSDSRLKRLSQTTMARRPACTSYHSLTVTMWVRKFGLECLMNAAGCCF